MAKDKLLGVMLTPEFKKEFESIARAKGVSASNLAREYIRKSMVKEVQGQGFPTLAELGDESSINHYVQMRFGLHPATATDIVDFFKHLATTLPDPHKALELKRFLDGHTEEAPLFDAQDEFKAALVMCGMGGTQANDMMRAATKVAQ
jgi:hypothetical protein